MNYGIIFNHLVPKAQWSCSGEPTDYNNFVWLDDRPQPTQQECEAAAAGINAVLEQKEAESARRKAYRAEADPLFFGWQRGENTEQEWLDKVAEIRGRYPYPA